MEDNTLPLHPDYTGHVVPKPFSGNTSLMQAPLSLRLRQILMGIIGGVALTLILAGLGHWLEWGWLFWTGMIGGPLLLLAAVAMGLNSQVAPCPYCGEQVGTESDYDLMKDDEQKPVRCRHCYEWMLSHQGQLTEVTEMSFIPKKMRVPVLSSMQWPEECICCGAPAVRYEALKKISLDGMALLVGTLSVRTATVKDAPYCAAHAGEVSVVISDDQPMLQFQHHGALRRYLAVNRGKLAVTKFK